MIPLEQVNKSENEKKKKYLRSYQAHVRRIKRIESDLEEIRSMKQYPSMSSDGMPHASNNSDLSSYAAVIDKKERELLREKNLRVMGYKDVTHQIELLASDKEKDVLHYRYIKGYDWWEIAEKMGYSERQIHRYHGKALVHFSVPRKDVSECQ